MRIIDAIRQSKEQNPIGKGGYKALYSFDDHYLLGLPVNGSADLREILASTTSLSTPFVVPYRGFQPGAYGEAIALIGRPRSLAPPIAIHPRISGEDLRNHKNSHPDIVARMAAWEQSTYDDLLAQLVEIRELGHVVDYNNGYLCNIIVDDPDASAPKLTIVDLDYGNHPLAVEVRSDVYALVRAFHEYCLHTNHSNDASWRQINNRLISAAKKAGHGSNPKKQEPSTLYYNESSEMAGFEASLALSDHTIVTPQNAPSVRPLPPELTGHPIVTLDDDTSALKNLLEFVMNAKVGRGS